MFDENEENPQEEEAEKSAEEPEEEEEERPKPAAKPAPKPAAKPTPKPAAKPTPKPAPKVEEEEEEATEEEKEEPEASSGALEGGRWVCPKCGNNNPRMIREETDKSILLNAYPPVYGKKLKCGQCGATWHHK